jgi:hypothetical protein
MRFTLWILLLCCFRNADAQKILEIDISHFNKFKKVQLFNNSYIEYKLKGEHTYRIDKMVAINDSMIVFKNDSTIFISQIKSIKLRNASILAKLFGSFFLIGGTGFILLDTFNNITNGQAKIIDERAVVASASLIAASLIIKQFTIKRIRINKHHSLRVLDINYQSLNK